MTYIIHYEDGSMENFKATTTQVLGELSITQALLTLYAKMYVQDFHLDEFKKWWSARAVGTLTLALFKSDGTPISEVVHFSVAMERTRTVDLYLAIDNDRVFLIHPTKALRANKVAKTLNWSPRAEASV